MCENIKINIEKSGISLKASDFEKAKSIYAEFCQDKEAYTGWVNYPACIDKRLLQEMKSVADKVCEKCNKLIVVGIGGSYLGTAAVIDVIGQNVKPGRAEIVFAGNNLSGEYHASLETIVEENDVCICVVSKSGGTMEPRIAFSVLKDMLYRKYGREEANRRIIAITDPETGMLRAEAEQESYITFDIPSNIGGRYSAFTPGIMFPLAVAGVDIEAFVSGAAALVGNDSFWESEGLKYALARFALLNAGKDIEALECYNPSWRLLGEWCKQLFGESEGKDGKGLFPVSLTFSTDLHSMGQFLQEGNQIFFETVFNVKNESRDVIIPETAGKELAGLSLNEINQMAVKGVVAAHRKANIPIIQIEIEDSKEYSIGQLLYFLMMTSGVTGKLMGVDPFNQPGVEAYKSEIRTLLGQ